MICTKVKGEPIYEVIKSISTQQELVVFYLPERPEELFFSRMRSTFYRQTMDSILEGNWIFQFFLCYINIFIDTILNNQIRLKF